MAPGDFLWLAMGSQPRVCFLFLRALCMPTELLPTLNDIVLRTGYELFIVDAEDMILSELIAHMTRPTKETNRSIGL